MNKQMFSEYFANKRKSLNLSLNNVAEKLSLTIPAIYKYEKGNSYPDLTILADIANLFEVDLDSLLSCGNTKNNNYCEEFKFDIEKFAAYFSFLRKYNNLTLNELAKKIDVQYQTISKWEKGESLPNIEKFILVANIFNVSYSDLYFAFGINKEKQLKGTKKMPTKPIVFTSVGLLLMIIFICIFIIKNDKPKDIKYLYKPCDETIKLENIFFEPFAPSQEQEFAVMYINEKYIPCEGHVYSFDDEFYVYASYKSKVVSVEPYTAFDNTYTVILEYENLQFTYNCLQEPSVEEGQTLKTGQKVGIAQKINMNHKEFYGLYYIIKVHNRLVNPTVAFKTKINDLLDETYGF